MSIKFNNSTTKTKGRSWMGNTIPNLVTNGLVLRIDPTQTSSYPGTGTTINDLSGSGNTVTLTGSTTTRKPIFTTTNQGSFYFTTSTTGGSDNPYFNIPPSSTINDLGPLTASMWLWINPTVSHDQVWFYKSDSNGVAGWWIELSGNLNNSGAVVDGLNFAIVGSTDARYAIPRSAIPTFQWVNITATWNGVFPSPTIKFYINGVLSTATPIVNTTGAGTRSSDAPYPMTFGKVMTTASYAVDYAGYTGIMLLYNRDLTDSEILQNYQATNHIYNPVLTTYTPTPTVTPTQTVTPTLTPTMTPTPTPTPTPLPMPIPYIYTGSTPNIVYDFAATGSYFNSGTTIADLSGNNNNGTTTSGSTITLTACAINSQGNAYFKNATPAFLSMYGLGTASGGSCAQTAAQQYSIATPTSQTITGTTPYTIVEWVNMQGMCWTSLQPAFWGNQGAATTSGMFLGYDVLGPNNGYRLISARSNGTANTVNVLNLGTGNIPNIQLGQWYMVAFRYDGVNQNISFYTNGNRYDASPVADAASVPSPLATNSLDYIGARASQWVQMLLGYFAMYHVDIGTTGTDAIYNNTRARYGTNA